MNETLARLVHLQEDYPHGHGIYRVQCEQLFKVYEGSPESHAAIGIVEIPAIFVFTEDQFKSFDKPGMCCVMKSSHLTYVKVGTLPTFPLTGLVL